MEDNPNVCNDTKDKVFLPSYQDYRNTNYGFASTNSASTTRECETTDWAKANGAYYPAASYWTRSPHSGSGYALSVGSDGSFSGTAVYIINGVRPAIYFSMEEQN